MEKLKLSSSEAEHINLIRDFILRQAAPGRRVSILEAGCGSSWSIRLDGVEFHLTGIDIDEAALALRCNIQKDLNETIYGDLRTVDLGDRKFDVIYNSFVLEHICGAEEVLNNLVSWLRPSGILIIRIPDPRSTYGFVTKMTPHWFHILFYRFFLRIANAGKPGYPPYRTYYDSVVSRKGMLDYCTRNNIIIEAEVGDGLVRQGKGPAQLIITFVKRMLVFVSGGRLSDRHVNLLYVLRRGDH